MTKSVSFTRPKKKVPVNAETWVSGNAADTAPVLKAIKTPVSMKRLTIDIPEELHRRVKSGCAVRGEKIAEVIRRILDVEFPAS